MDVLHAAPDSLRLHHHLPLSLPAAHDGAGTAYCRPQDDGSPHQRRTLQYRSPILGAHLFRQVSRRRRHWDPYGIPVRYELVCSLRAVRAVSSVSRLPWKASFRSFSNLRSLASFCSEKSGFQNSPTGEQLSSSFSVPGSPASSSSLPMRGCSIRWHIGFCRIGTYEVSSFWRLMMNPWAWLQYAHNMSGAVITGAFVMAAVGALYVLQNREGDYGRIFLKLGVLAGLISCIAQIFPTGDLHGKYVANHQPAAMAGMEGLFHTQKGAPIVLMGQPDIEAQKIDNPLAVNRVLSFLIYGTIVLSLKKEGWISFPATNGPAHCLYCFTATTSWRAS